MVNQLQEKVFRLLSPEFGGEACTAAVFFEAYVVQFVRMFVFPPFRQRHVHSREDHGLWTGGENLRDGVVENTVVRFAFDIENAS